MKLLALLVLSPLTALAGYSWEPALERDSAYFFEATALTRAFDADREAGITMARSRSYRELQDLRARWESHQHRALASVPPGERREFYRALEKTSLDRLAHSNLIDHLHALAPASERVHGDFPRALDAESARAAYENHAGDIERESAKYRRAFPAPRAGGAFVNPIAALATVFKPSPGPDGNVYGSNFPEKTWAITFDDGPNDTTTPKIIDAFIARKRNLTFFHLAEMAMKNPSTVAKAKAAGFALENHSFTHEKLTTVAAPVQRHEIVDSTTELAKLYGKRPGFFRLPYGAGVNDKTLRQLIADQKMIHVFWNVDSLDWSDKNPDSVLRRVRTEMGRLKKGVVLYHDIHPTTVTTAELLLKYLEALEGSKEAVRLVTLPQIVKEMNSGKGL